MKQRSLSGIIGIILAVLVISQFDSIIFNIICALIYLIAVYEISGAYKEDNSIFVNITLGIFGCVVLMNQYLNVPFYILCTLFILSYAFIIVFQFEKISFRNVSTNFAFGLFVLFGIFSIVNLKTMMPYSIFGSDAAFVFSFIAAISWGGDTSAYFAGYFFGKNKLAPKLSPKKTKEGAVGGVLGSAIFSNLFLYIYYLIKPTIDNSSEVYEISTQLIIIITVVAVIGSCIGIIGDLFASAIKRQVGIKDYGNIMPGHGGVLDRFDSVLLVAPFVIATVSGFIVSAGGIFNV